MIREQIKRIILDTIHVHFPSDESGWKLVGRDRATDQISELVTSTIKTLEDREQRGRDYLVQISGIGSEDPMDFLIASHAYIAAERQDLKRQLREAGRRIAELEQQISH